MQLHWFTTRWENRTPHQLKFIQIRYPSRPSFIVPSAKRRNSRSNQLPKCSFNGASVGSLDTPEPPVERFPTTDWVKLTTTPSQVGHHRFPPKNSTPKTSNAVVSPFFSRCSVFAASLVRNGQSLHLYEKMDRNRKCCCDWRAQYFPNCVIKTIRYKII